MIDVIAVDRVAPQPWRNGGGFTRQLLAWPSAQDWLARISVAEITRDGAFSAFPGIERWFAVLEGHGVVLRFAADRVVLDTHSDALQFDGAATPMAELQDGATRDLNLMVRRDAAAGAMQRALPDTEWVHAAPLRALFVTAPSRLQIDDADAAHLPAFAMAWSAHAQHQRWRVVADAEPAAAWWLWCRPNNR
jgi:environmental stress-induced protein Ves